MGQDANTVRQLLEMLLLNKPLAQQMPARQQNIASQDAQRQSNISSQNRMQMEVEKPASRLPVSSEHLQGTKVTCIVTS